MERLTRQEYISNPTSIKQVNLPSYMGLYQRLAEYEDAEEQGLLIKLPCKVGDTLYGIVTNEVKEYKVFSINIGMREDYNSCVILARNSRNSVVSFELIDFNKTVFLTREAAEEALKK